MSGQKGPTLSTLKGSPGLSHKTVKMLINLIFIFLGDTQKTFLSKLRLKQFRAGYILLKATTKVEIMDCSLVPLKTQNIPKPQVSYRGMRTTPAQSNKGIESLVPNQLKYLNGRKK